jgi:hypothetical protein
MHATTKAAITELALLLTEGCAIKAQQPRINTGATHVATDIASKYLTPHVPAGLMQWLVAAQVRETPRQYARRAILCLVARSTQAGLPCTLSHEGAEAVGQRDGHGSVTRGGNPAGRVVQIVSSIERTIARGTETTDDSQAARS